MPECQWDTDTDNQESLCLKCSTLHPTRYLLASILPPYCEMILLSRDKCSCHAILPFSHLCLKSHLHGLIVCGILSNRKGPLNPKNHIHIWHITLRYIQIARRRMMIRNKNMNLQHQVKIGHRLGLRILSKYHTFRVRGILWGHRVPVLIDGGASHNFIDVALVKRRGIPTEEFEYVIEL